MASDLNKFQCIGRLGKDPDLNYTPNGDAVVNFSVALGESWKDKQTGQKQERTEWVRFVAWRKLAEIIGQHLSKGSRVYLEGKFTTRKFQDAQTGEDRYITEIVTTNMQMLDTRQDSQQNGYQQQSQQAPAPAQQQQRQQQRQQAAPTQQAAPQGFDNQFDDDIPF